MDEHYSTMMAKGFSGIHRHYHELDEVPDNTGILNVDMSFDRTLMTHGHMSHIGVGLVMEVDTRIIIDFEVLSNFCLACSIKRKKLPEAEFQAWKL